MNEQLLLRIKYTADDYIKASVSIRDTMFIHRYGFLLAFAAIFLATVVFVFGLSNDRETIRCPTLGIIAFTLAFLVSAAVFLLDKYVFPVLAKQSLKEEIKSSPSLNIENEVCFSEEGLEISNELAGSRYKWDAFLKAFESDSAFIFYTSINTSVFIPKTALVSEADLSLLRSLLKAKISDKSQFYTHIDRDGGSKEF